MKDLSVRSISPKVPSATPKTMVPWIVEALEDGPRHRDDLFEFVAKLAEAKGFTAKNIRVLSKGLSRAKDESKIVNLQKGWWCLPETNVLTGLKTLKKVENTVFTLGRRSITALRTIGEGPDTVYVLYSKPHAEIAMRDGQQVWPCKIGKTKAGLGQRLLNGGSSTFVSEEPIVGLAIKCLSASAVETVIQKSLYVAGRWIQQETGQEWYITSPQYVETFYIEWCKICTSFET